MDPSYPLLLKKGINYLFFQLLLWPGSWPFLPLGCNVFWDGQHAKMSSWTAPVKSMDGFQLSCDDVGFFFFSFLVFILIYCPFFLTTPHSRHILPPPKLKIHMVNLFNLILSFRKWFEDIYKLIYNFNCFVNTCILIIAQWLICVT